MATAAAVSKRTTFLHERGNWNARDDRVPSAVWLGIFWVGILAGFGVDLQRYFHERPAAPLVAHVHAVVFSVWLLIMTAQVAMVVGDRVGWHRKFGWFAAAWTVLMAVLGPWAALSSLALNLNTPGFTPAFLAVNIVDVGGFLIFIGWGLASRKNPAAHKRLIMLAMVAIADPGFARFTGNLWHEPKSAVPWFFFYFYGNVVLLLLMALWDWRQGRLMRQFVIGAVGLTTALLVASVLFFWPPWTATARGWVEAWARVMG
ncbi:hypothetical protein Acid345_3578 [Candidatus Koribacter versatilis Ellin345]|uniref:Membrane protein (DUF2306) n=1 Tax=Koribacter versatilis (strain Ellin345) TaxID=204669 RepID=Q1IKM1_KORVE|nr:hypothetical protein [Candidatus Koribacter versatilis]ABF42579.1 hypothetical protein Acid345_3578 [Candidatus Koribacter versatilis Ellin345]